MIGKIIHAGVENYRWFDDAGHVTPEMVQDITRILLSLVFITCGVLVWKAWQMKKGNGEKGIES